MPISRLPELPCDTSVSNTGSSSAEAKLPSDSPVQNSTAESSTAITRDGRLLLVFAVCDRVFIFTKLLSNIWHILLCLLYHKSNNEM